MSSHHSSKSFKATRTKGNTKRGAKKGGGGGKFTFGRPGDELDEAPILPGDPMYDELAEEEAAYEESVLRREDRDAYKAATAASSPSVASSGAGASATSAGGPKRTTLSQYKAKVVPVIEEFFVSEDVEEFARSAEEINTPFFKFELIKRAITMSMDRGTRERELVSRMITELYGTLFNSDQVGKAFERLFELADDLVIDIPDAYKIIANFLAKAVVDEVLPPSFLSDRLVEDLGGPVVEQAKTLLSLRHSGARIEHIWGPGGATPVSELKKAILLILQEYKVSFELGEAVRSLRELGVPMFHHEVVKRSLVLAMDGNDETCELFAELLEALHTEQVVSEAQFIRGFNRTFAALPDITLDDPSAPAWFETFVDRAKAYGYLPADYNPVPGSPSPKGVAGFGASEPPAVGLPPAAAGDAVPGAGDVAASGHSAEGEGAEGTA